MCRQMMGKNLMMVRLNCGRGKFQTSVLLKQLKNPFYPVPGPHILQQLQYLIATSTQLIRICLSTVFIITYLKSLVLIGFDFPVVDRLSVK